ncbi:MAG: metal ABC transporter ATP-binding protein [Anaerolineales bacterium]|jgi:manganese/iron transport system ATP-binding protein
MTIFENLRKRPFSRPAEHEPDRPMLEVAHLNVRYDHVTALEDVSFQLERGERVAVVGPNGAGKSTLFKVIAGVLQPTSGMVNVSGHVPGGHICIAYLPQRSNVDWTFPVSVADVVMMGRIGKLGIFRWPKSSDWDYVHQCLDDVGLLPLAERQISELSGGQQQRMFIARALAQEAEIMLMDEPLSGLDVQSQEDIYAILDKLRHRAVTVMVATHDLDQAATHFDRAMLLNHRLLGFDQPGEVFTTERLVMAYGGHLRLVENGESGLLALGDTCCDEGEEP